jgi:hypothetical protein
MKTLVALTVVVLALAPSFALADGLLARSLSAVHSDPIHDAIDHPANGGDPIHDAIKPVIHSDINMLEKPVIHSDINLLAKPTIHSTVNLLGTKKAVVVKTKSVIGAGLLACSVKGTPSEFPDDLVITNMGLTTIQAGAQFKWSVKAPKLSGYGTISRHIDPGQSIRLNSVLPGGLEAGTPCTAKLL